MSINYLITQAFIQCINRAGIKDFSNYDTRIYPFTTENIAGYVELFDLKNKSLLTVGSSGDQILNSILYGCQDITVIDVNIYSKMYYYLKVACILELSMEEFFKFLRFMDYPKEFCWNEETFDKNMFLRIRDTLKSVDYESFIFWNELFKEIDSETMRVRLFMPDENTTSIIKKCNKYLSSEIQYLELKKKILNTYVKFQCGDIQNIELKKKFNNIWLSNIGIKIGLNNLKNLIFDLEKHLKEEGQLLINYYYDTVRDTIYHYSWNPIYDLSQVLNAFENLNPSLYTFDGVKSSNDSVLVYKKKK